MSTEFLLDLNSNTLKFGTIAEGQMVDFSSNIVMSSKAQDIPFGGTISGSFIGEIKGTQTIPITIPHKRQDLNIFNIIVIGVGGTGGYLIRDLARFAFALKTKNDSRVINITLVDGDLVEDKNVLRQNFTQRDIGKHKATVLARRYSKAFGLEIEALTEMLTPQNIRNMVQRGAYNHPEQTVFVGCIDNHEARRTIANYLRNQHRTYWIDSGNETKSGQVVLGYSNGRDWRFSPPSRNSDYGIPFVTDLYPEIMDPLQDEVTDEKISCAERTMTDTQNIFVNMTAAGHALSYVRQIVMQEPITINSIEFNIKGVTNVQHLTEGHLRKVYEAGVQ